MFSLSQDHLRTWGKWVCAALRAHRILLILVALALVRGTLYAAVVPPWQAPDETGHFEYVWLAAHLRRIPTKDDIAPGFERQLIESLYEWRFGGYLGRPLPPEPPERIGDLPTSMHVRKARILMGERFSLNYAWQALFALPLLDKGMVTQLYAARLSSVALNALIVALAYLAARELFSSRQRSAGLSLPALLMTALVILNPQHTFINAMVGDGILAEAMAGLAVYGWVRAFRRRHLGAFEAAAIVIGTVLGIAAKVTVLYLVPVDAALGLSWLARQARGGWRWRYALVLLLGSLVVGAGFVVWRDSRWGQMVAYLLSFLPDPAKWRWVDMRGTTLLEALQLTHDTAWASFGWLNVSLAGRWYGAIVAFSVLLLVGWASPRRPATHSGTPSSRRSPSEGSLAADYGTPSSSLTLSPSVHQSVHRVSHWAGPMMSLCVITALAGHVLMNMIVYAAANEPYSYQGRYLFPIIVPWAYLLAEGAARLFARRDAPFYLLLACLIILDAWAIAVRILPHYYG